MLHAAAALLPWAAAFTPRAAAPRMQDSTALRRQWDSGAGACTLRPLVEAAAPSVRSATLAVSSDTATWAGLWVARIEHFEKVAFTGLRVNPHYDLSADGGIVSHVHIALGPFGLWTSASGYMDPASSGGTSVRLHFDDFWVGPDAASPRDAPPPDAGGFDGFTRWLGRLAFFEGLADFPLDYADMAEPGSIVAFRFPPLDSCIVAQRAPAGATPQPCA